MLHWIYQWWADAMANETTRGTEGWAHAFSALNLLKYITFRAGLACILAFVLSLLFGDYVIRKLVSLKLGQPIRGAAEVHKLNELHGGKAGTPTMGGVLILAATLIVTFVCGRPLNPFVAVCACTMLALGLLGFCDDYRKVKEKKSDGISARAKIGWQFAIAIVASLFIYAIYDKMPGFRLGDKPIGIGDICFPLFKQPIINIHWFAIPFFALIIVGCSNAVNLTDGLDGLATGCTISTGMAYATLAYLAGHVFMATEYLKIPYNSQIGELSVFLMGLVGAAFGFLWFNCHPARMFMGDTGSLAIGGALGTAAVCVKQELLLVIIGAVFVAEAMSVIMQVGYFKMTGKRIFRMSPIHHHFELGGWHESQVIVRFWILSIFFALGGLALLKIL